MLDKAGVLLRFTVWIRPVGQAQQTHSTAATDASGRAQTFSLHVGGELHLPTRGAAAAPAPPAVAAAPPEQHVFFDGVPLRAWAEALGERVMPAYEAVKDEAKAAKAAAARGAAPPPEMQAPAVPHFLPFTRWRAPRTASVAPPENTARACWVLFLLTVGSVVADLLPEPRGSCARWLTVRLLKAAAGGRPYDVLPLSVWSWRRRAGARRAAQSKVIQDTFVVDEKNKKKARLSWYHPADTVRARPPA
jgi:hypothetical protein